MAPLWASSASHLASSRSFLAFSSITASEAIEAFHFCRVALSNCQELYFLEDTATLILQTDASDYDIGDYLYMTVNREVRIIRFFSKSLVGSQLNLSAGEKERYAIYYDAMLFEDLLDNRYFILMTDHMNLTYINVTFTGKVLRWKLYLQDKDFDLYHVSGKEEHQFVPDALSRLCVNHMPPAPTDRSSPFVMSWTYPEKSTIDYPISTTLRGHVGLELCKRRHKKISKQRIKDDLAPEDAIPDHMISEFLRQCPYCQFTNRLGLPIKAHRFTCASIWGSSSGSHWTTGQRCT